MILWVISDVTTTAVFLSAGSVTVITTVAMAQMRGTAVSICPSVEQLIRLSYLVFFVWFNSLFSVIVCDTNFPASFLQFYSVQLIVTHRAKALL